VEAMGVMALEAKVTTDIIKRRACDEEVMDWLMRFITYPLETRDFADTVSSDLQKEMSLNIFMV